MILDKDNLGILRFPDSGNGHLFFDSNENIIWIKNRIDF
jgi:hypothetical protein